MEYLIGGLVGFAIGAAFQRLVFGLVLWRWVSRKHRLEMRDIYKMPDGLKWPSSPQRRNYGAPDPPYTLPVPPKPPIPPKHSKRVEVQRIKSRYLAAERRKKRS